MINLPNNHLPNITRIIQKQWKIVCSALATVTSVCFFYFFIYIFFYYYFYQFASLALIFCRIVISITKLKKEIFSDGVVCKFTNIHSRDAFLKLQSVYCIRLCPFSNIRQDMPSDYLLLFNLRYIKAVYFVRFYSSALC